MRTIKQVSELANISVRTLQYYDEIGLFKPTKVTDAGYRMYDDDALEVLQQILFFKELNFSLKDIILIMRNPAFDKQKAFLQQKELIQVKRDRLNRLLKLLDRLVEGEKSMSFAEFDISGYFNMLEEFKRDHIGEIIERWGSINEFNTMVEGLKSKESEIAQMAVKQYGSIEKFTEAMKKNLDNVDELDSLKENTNDAIHKADEITRKLTSDLSKDVSAMEVQKIVDELVVSCNEWNRGIDMGENYWRFLA
ncbi:MAG: MerR family transcriptional regulator, partial [Chitinophagales bacterium]